MEDDRRASVTSMMSMGDQDFVGLEEQRASPEPKKTHLPGGFSERSEDLSLCPPQALKFLNSTLYVEISLGLPTREKP